MSQRKQFGAEMAVQSDDLEHSKYDAVATQDEQHELKKYDVVIVGAGLGGLTAAVEASIAGKSVLVIESRQEKFSAIRPQLIFLKLEIKRYLLWQYVASGKDFEDKGPNIVGGNKFYSRHFSIKDIQHALLRMIGDSCQFQYEAMVSEIDLDDGLLQVSSLTNPSLHEKIKFENLVIADGAKRRTANLLQPQIKYQPVADRPEKKHVMAYFTVEAKGELPDCYLKPEPLVMLKHENSVGYFYYDDGNEKIESKREFKVCVVMNATDEQYDIYKSNEALGVKYLKHCVASVFPSEFWSIEKTASKKIGLEKDRLKYAAFELDFVEVSTPAFERNSNKIFFVGDARRSPDFYLGHGGNDAILDGKFTGDVIRGEKTIDQYNDDCIKRSKATSLETKSFQPIMDKVDADAYMNAVYFVPKFVNVADNSIFELQPPLDVFGFFSLGGWQLDSSSDDEESKLKLSRPPH